MTQKCGSVSFMSRSWLINSRAIAKKIRNPGSSSSVNQIKDYGANRECPNCHYRIDNSDVSHEWPGLPAGVKFDPSDVELLEHLAAKCGLGNLKAHMLIEEFIPTLDVDGGICYTHPENLPGAKKDGSSVHFFHKTINAYSTGQRKRRKIQSEHCSDEEHVRWHKTGKTKCIMENGEQKGCKKIMVLYKNSKKGSKPDKSNWVMHQYHLGTDEDEKDGEYVVSKVFYQQTKPADKIDDSLMVDEFLPFQTSPRTPNPKTPNLNPPNPPRPTGTSISCDDAIDDVAIPVSVQAQKITKEEPQVSSTDIQLENNMDDPTWLAGESQAAENSALDCIDDSLLCKEILGASNIISNNYGVNQDSYTAIPQNAHQFTENNNAPCGIAELANLEFDTPPDLFADLQFGSQDSIFDWIDRL